MAGASTDYVIVVGSMLVAITIDVALVAAYALVIKPRRWGLIAALLAGLTIMEYAVAEGVIYAFGITP